MRAKCAVVLAAILLLAAGPVFSQSGKPLVNDDVVQMVKGGFDENTTVAAIEAADVNFDTSVQALMALKAAGVSEKIISTMLAATKKKAEAAKATAPAAPAAAPAAANPDVPEDIGVYIKVRGKLVDVVPEVVGWKTGGALKSFATNGLTKGHVNGTIQGPKSALQIGTDAEFIIKCPEGTAVTEYQLLRLDMKNDRREFRAVTGGIIHASGGAEKNAEKFDYEKVAARVFRVKLPPLKKGEYGILPPGSTSGNVASSGKLYSFGIAE